LRTITKSTPSKKIITPTVKILFMFNSYLIIDPKPLALQVGVYGIVLQDMDNKKILLAVVSGLALVVVVGGIVWLIMKPKAKSSLPTIIEDTTTVLPTVVMSGNRETIPTIMPTAQIVESTGKEVMLTVEASNYKFAPTTLKVKKGDTVVINFKNSQGMHDFVIDEFEVKTSQLGEDEEEEVEFVASKTGTFEYYCSVGTHRKMGMVGKLIVE
jgi:plastocyanin